MFCKNCGREISNNAVVCPYCGVQTSAPVKAQQPVRPAQTVIYQPAPTQVIINQPAPRKSNTAGVVGFVFSLLSFFLGEFFLIAPFIGFICSCVGVAKRKSCTDNNGLAVAGLIINILQLVGWLIILIVCGSLLLGLIGMGTTMM